MRVLPPIPPILLAGCWLSHAPAVPDESACDPDAQPTCVRRSEVACGPAEMVAAERDEESLEWRCPTGSRRYEVTGEGELCLPFAGSGSIARLSGAPVPVPTDDGRASFLFSFHEQLRGDARLPTGRLNTPRSAMLRVDSRSWTPRSTCS